MEKTAFRKNLDKRYISGEDLANGEELGKGLKKEMIVTLAKFNDAPAFDQKEQKEVSKTAIWMKEHPSGKLIYKPCLLNVSRAEFLSKELANNSLFIDDCDVTKPFILYAKPDRRHGFVVAFKKHYAPSTVSDTKALAELNKCSNTEELSKTWAALTQGEKNLPSVTALKNKLKTTLK